MENLKKAISIYLSIQTNAVVESGGSGIGGQSLTPEQMENLKKAISIYLSIQTNAVVESGGSGTVGPSLTPEQMENLKKAMQLMNTQSTGGNKQII